MHMIINDCGNEKNKCKKMYKWANKIEIKYINLCGNKNHNNSACPKMFLFYSHIYFVIYWQD